MIVLETCHQDRIEQDLLGLLRFKHGKDLFFLRLYWDQTPSCVLFDLVQNLHPNFPDLLLTPFLNPHFCQTVLLCSFETRFCPFSHLFKKGFLVAFYECQQIVIAFLHVFNKVPLVPDFLEVGGVD